MRIAVPKETLPGERRVALVPESCKKLVGKGIAVAVESGAGDSSYFLDDVYRQAGASIEKDPGALLDSSDLTLKVQPPAIDEVARYREGSLLLCTCLPRRNIPAIHELTKRKMSVFSTDRIPRISRAQSMDTLSSMASISGYKAVLIAANALTKFFPMFMTAAGTVFATKVFVIGAGVAGLQAIATAKRLGAVVTATDSRKAVAEQIQSIGGKYIGVESDEDAQTSTGYARQLSAEYYRKQAEIIAQQCATNSVVITTALVGGGSAPKLITANMVSRMQPGSIIVDLAAEGGGNCELSKAGETVVDHDVTIIAPLHLLSTMPHDASTLLSHNLTNFVLAFWLSQEGRFNLDLKDEIIDGALIIHDGKVRCGPTQEAPAQA